MNNKILLTCILFIFLPFISFAADNLAEKLSGRILLAVEQNGEAWYVSPENQWRYFLGRPADAFAVMREQGVGITNTDLARLVLPRFP